MSILLIILKFVHRQVGTHFMSPKFVVDIGYIYKMCARSLMQFTQIRSKILVIVMHFNNTTPTISFLLILKIAFVLFVVSFVFLITSNKNKTNTLCFIFFQLIHMFLLPWREKKISTLKAQAHNSRSVYLQCTDRAVNVDAGFVKILIVKVKTDWSVPLFPHTLSCSLQTQLYLSLCPVKLRKS